MNWNIVPFAVDILVYADVRTALQALLQGATTLQAQRLEKGKAALFSDHIYFRGHPDASYRVLPTRLRGKHHEPEVRQRFSLRDQSDEARQHLGDWVEEMEMRDVETLLSELPEEELSRRSEMETSYIKRAAEFHHLSASQTSKNVRQCATTV